MADAAMDAQGRSRKTHEWRCAVTVKKKAEWSWGGGHREWDEPCEGTMEFSPAHAWKYYRSAPACTVDARHGPMAIVERKW